MPRRPVEEKLRRVAFEPREFPTNGGKRYTAPDVRLGMEFAQVLPALITHSFEGVRHA
jgi:hypothetical protein